MRLWLDLLFRPTLGARRVSHTKLGGYGALAVLGGLWTGLMVLLALGNHQPTMSRGLFVAPERYYLTAALYIGPLCMVLGEIYSRIACAVAGADDRRCALRIAYAAVVGSVFVLPDLFAYLFVGHEAMGLVVRLTAPITVVWLLASSTAALREATTSGRRAFAAALIALIVQAIPAALLIR
jgi:hypothetical protein